MAKNQLPTPEELRQLIAYDPDTGRLSWRCRPPSAFKQDGANGPERAAAIWNSRYCGTPALNWANTHGHLCGDLRRASGRVKLYAHRVAWAITHGEWPDTIDHINGNPADNRIANLRSVSQRENSRNQRKRSTNISGITGVRFYKGRKKWIASITVDGVERHLGYFTDVADAVAVRREAEASAGFSARHGL